MTHKAIPMMVLLMAALILAVPPPLSAGVRCSGEVISEGDTTYEARKHCGDPDHIDAWEEERIMRDFRRRRLDENDIYRRGRGYREPFLVKETIRVEIWIYDWGPSRLIHRLRFENGRLTDIETGGYGNP
jgi:hypothetical protein